MAASASIIEGLATGLKRSAGLLDMIFQPNGHWTWKTVADGGLFAHNPIAGVIMGSILGANTLTGASQVVDGTKLLLND